MNYKELAGPWLHASWLKRCSRSKTILPPQPFEILVSCHSSNFSERQKEETQETEIDEFAADSTGEELFADAGSGNQDTELSGHPADKSQGTSQTDSQATEVAENTPTTDLSEIWKQRREFQQAKLSSVPSASAVAKPTSPAAVQPEQVKGFQRYAAVRSGTAASETHNKWLTSQLDAIASWYSDAPEAVEDQFRARQFGMLSNLFGGFPEMKPSSSDMLDAITAVQQLPRVNNTAQELREWLVAGAAGDLPRLQRLRSSAVRQELKELQQVWGIGLKNAQRLRAMGFGSVRLLQRCVFGPLPVAALPPQLPRDVVARLQQATSDVQRGHALGLTGPAITSLPFTAEIQRRIPRAEIESLFAGIQSTLTQLYPPAIAQVCGSFRRGAASSGDIDVLITHPDGGLLDIRPLLRILSICGGLVAHLASPDLPPVFGSFSRSSIQKLDAATDADLSRKQMYMGIGVDKGVRSLCMATLMLRLLQLAPRSSSCSDAERKQHVVSMLPWIAVAAPIESTAHADVLGLKRQVNHATLIALSSLAAPSVLAHSCRCCVPAASERTDAAETLYASPAASEDSDALGSLDDAPGGGHDPTASPVPLTQAVGLDKALAANTRISAGTKQRLVQLLPILWHIESFLGHWGPGRRVDIKSYVAAAYPFAVLYFTGSAYFNRSMRFYADNNGLTLSDTGVARVTARDKRRGIRQAQAKERHLRTERDIFDFLGIPWKEPWERNCLPIDVNSIPLGNSGATAHGGASEAGGQVGAAPASISPAQLLRDERCVKMMTAILKDQH